jgi:mitogen-activated protein kinase 1/3
MSDAVVFELPSTAFIVDAVVGQGAYGAVCRASITGHPTTLVAIKKIPAYAKSAETAKRVLREILILRHFQCVGQIVATHMMFRPVSQEKDLYIVMDYVPSDISNFLKNATEISEPMIQFMVAQMLLGLRAMHKVDCVHRDLSTRNVLLNASCEIQIADFGLSRFFDPEERMSFGVVTQWYRAPEVITDASYGEKVDVWSVGVIMAELFMQGHIFPGKPNDLADQLNRIMKILGVPDVKLFSDEGSALASSSDNAKRYIQRVAASSRAYKRTLFTAAGPVFKLQPSDTAKDFMSQLLTFSPDERPSADETLKHAWFDGIREYIDEHVAAQEAELQPFEGGEALLMAAGQTGDHNKATFVDEIERLVPTWTKELEADVQEIAVALAPAEDE